MVSHCLDHGCLSCAWRTMAQNTELVGISRDGILPLFFGEVLEELQKRLLLGKEEALERLLVGQFEPPVLASRRVPAFVAFLLLATDSNQLVHVARVILHLAELAEVPRIRLVDEGIHLLLGRALQAQSNLLCRALDLLALLVGLLRRLHEHDARLDCDPLLLRGGPRQAVVLLELARERAAVLVLVIAVGVAVPGVLLDADEAYRGVPEFELLVCEVQRDGAHEHGVPRVVIAEGVPPLVHFLLHLDAARVHALGRLLHVIHELLDGLADVARAVRDDLEGQWDHHGGEHVPSGVARAQRLDGRELGALQIQGR
mmetsp:Transcript_78136/g.203593  ORF Transcript_78136/g.203593 Transcript_78136/m.203593 type:complete len:315 (-) Transcript_78136:85-1029(-)